MNKLINLNLIVVYALVNIFTSSLATATAADSLNGVWGIKEKNCENALTKITKPVNLSPIDLGFEPVPELTFFEKGGKKYIQKSVADGSCSNTKNKTVNYFKVIYDVHLTPIQSKSFTAYYMNGSLSQTESFTEFNKYNNEVTHSPYVINYRALEECGSVANGQILKILSAFALPDYFLEESHRNYILIVEKNNLHLWYYDNLICRDGIVKLVFEKK